MLSNEWSVTIFSGRNGYRMEWDDVLDDGSTAHVFEVIEDDFLDDLKHHEKLLCWIADFFGFSGSKHDHERIKVVREKRES
jgi:hypothetical protein